MKRKQPYSTLTLLFLIFSGQFSFAQINCNNKPSIDVDYTSGCAPFTININTNNLTGFGSNISIQYKFESNSDYEVTTSHTYNTAGTYTLTRLIGDDNLKGCKTDQVQIQVFDPEPIDLNYSNCSNYEVELDIQNIQNLPYDQFEIFFGDGQSAIIPKNKFPINHQYSSTGSYNITYKGLIDQGKIDNCSSSGTLEVNPINSLAPPTLNSIDIIQSNPGEELTLNYTTQNNVEYKLFKSDNSSRNFLETSEKIDPSLEKHTITDLNTKENYYGFFLTAYDPCNGVLIHSDTLYTIALQHDPSINLEWNTHLETGYSIELRKDGTQIKSNLNPKDNFSDEDVLCNEQYQYILQMTDQNGNPRSKITSPFINASPELSFPPLKNLFATYEKNNIKLEWTAPDEFNPKDYFVKRATEGKNFQPIDTINATNYLDKTIDPSTSYCYQINFIDDCGNSSEISEVCPLFLTAEKGQTANITTFLSWTEYLGGDVENYTLLRFIKENQSAPEDLGLAQEYTDIDTSNQTITYQIKAIVDGKETFSNPVTVEYFVNPQFPTAFTPNNDNKNDIFKIIVGFDKFIESVRLQIYNRWGELIYQGSEWNGKINGQDAPKGNYLYSAIVTDLKGNTFQRSGGFVLIR
ncbi:T9SS type B sorting domain-containing protein [Xanthovirga aplysinae]|uniref:T9SS type B sorting domain-containing protein n=1 Tax=Xanthovirga aplysinae TaxID=2529853 RepID=UPI0012BC9CD4|nr:T9SS type B sorting domain-containing protein [Xanthovirga aplysinae]MTI33533.1 T9SS type B sorting domain-containing protein [Xanthovirga aplysinae]